MRSFSSWRAVGTLALLGVSASAARAAETVPPDLEPAPPVVGLVQDSAGNPLPNARVVIAELGRGTTTGSDGTFIFRGLRPGTYHLDATLLGYAPGHVEVNVPEDGPEVRVVIELRITPLTLSGIHVTASPAVTTPEGLIDLMLHLEYYLGWSFLELDVPEDPELGPMVALGIRVPLNEDVLAWPLVLGPFSFFAVTRDGPVTEVALMLKPKVYPLRSQITDDPGSAHLADLPVPLDDEAYERMWQNTRRQKALVLGDPAEPRAKAKVSLTLPAELWHGRTVLNV